MRLTGSFSRRRLAGRPTRDCSFRSSRARRGSRGRIRTADHRVKACCRNRLATRLCVAVSSGWSRLCLPCRIWQTHRRYSALSTRGIFMRVHHSLDTGASANPSLETTTLHFSIWRTGWDSNPRMLSHRRFSRPLPSSSRQPVHERFARS